MIRFQIQYYKTRDFIIFNFLPIRFLVGLALILLARGLVLFRRGPKALDLLSKAWRMDPGILVSRLIEKDFGWLTNQTQKSLAQLSIEALEPGLRKDWFIQFVESVHKAESICHNWFLILNNPDSVEKGLVYLQFTPVFPYILKMFGPKLFDHYHVVTEPSWVGTFAPEILSFHELPQPIWVIGNEIRDIEFLKRLNGNLIPLDLAANHFTNPNTFFPIESIPKTFDIVMVAAWQPYKRHHVLFKAMSQCKNPIKALFLSYPAPHLKWIKAAAKYYGVFHQCEFIEGLKPNAVNTMMQKAKAKILLSKREGCNRAIIEAMFSGIPAFIPSGFNYGTRYNYIRPETGGFFEEKNLPELLDQIHSGHFDHLRPRDWVMENLHPEKSCRRIEEAVYGNFKNRLALKVNDPESKYLNSEDRAQFQNSYTLLSTLLTPEMQKYSTKK